MATDYTIDERGFTVWGKTATKGKPMANKCGFTYTTISGEYQERTCDEHCPALGSESCEVGRPKCEWFRRPGLICGPGCTYRNGDSSQRGDCVVHLFAEKGEKVGSIESTSDDRKRAWDATTPPSGLIVGESVVCTGTPRGGDNAFPYGTVKSVFIGTPYPYMVSFDDGEDGFRVEGMRHAFEYAKALSVEVAKRCRKAKPESTPFASPCYDGSQNCVGEACHIFKTCDLNYKIDQPEKEESEMPQFECITVKVPTPAETEQGKRAQKIGDVIWVEATTPGDARRKVYSGEHYRALVPDEADRENVVVYAREFKTEK